MQRIKLALSAVATKYWVQLQNQKLEAGNEIWVYGEGRQLRRLGEKTVALKSSQPANKRTRKLQRYVKGNKCRKLELCICLSFQLSKLHFYFFRSPEKDRTDSKSFTRQLFRLFISRSFPPSRVFRPGPPWPSFLALKSKITHKNRSSGSLQSPLDLEVRIPLHYHSDKQALPHPQDWSFSFRTIYEGQIRKL